MTVDELIDKLTELRNTFGRNVEVVVWGYGSPLTLKNDSTDHSHPIKVIPEIERGRITIV